MSEYISGTGCRFSCVRTDILDNVMRLQHHQFCYHAASMGSCCPRLAFACHFYAGEVYCVPVDCKEGLTRNNTWPVTCRTQDVLTTAQPRKARSNMVLTSNGLSFHRCTAAPRRLK